MISSLRAGQQPLEVEQASLVPGLHKFVDQGGGGGEAHRRAPLAGGQAQPKATWVLPVPPVPPAITFSRRSMYSQWASSHHQCLFTRAWR